MVNKCNGLFIFEYAGPGKTERVCGKFFVDSPCIGKACKFHLGSDNASKIRVEMLERDFYLEKNGNNFSSTVTITETDGPYADIILIDHDGKEKDFATYELSKN